MGIRLRKKLVLLISVYYSASLLSGCWDYKEIEKRGYVLGISIDKIEKGNNQGAAIEQMPLETEGPLYEYTIQIPVISRSQNKASGQSGGNADKERHWNISVISNSFFEANREYSTRIDYAPFYPHLQAIVISEDVASEDMTRLFDMFLRDFEMRRRTKLYVTPGRAKDILNVIPKIDDYASQYLRFLPTNKDKTSRMLHKTDLGKVSEAMHENRDYVLSKVIANAYEIKDAGCAVFKKNKMVGWLDEIKTSYLKWITNYADGGVVSINIPNTKDDSVVLEMKKVNTKQRPRVIDDRVEMDLDVKANLNVAEINKTGVQNVIDENLIKQLQDLAEKKIKQQIESTIEYVQNEYGADVFFFGTNIKRFEPAVWDRIKDNWNEQFKALRVNVNVSVRINQIGLLR